MRVGAFGSLFAAALLAGAGVAAAANDDGTLAGAAEVRDAGAVYSLLAAGADVDAPAADGTTALHWAVHHDDLDMVRALIDAGADVNAANRYGATPLLLACTNGSAPVVDALLRAGANPDTFSVGETALMTAGRTGSVDAARLLLEHGADPHLAEELRGQTALMSAAAARHAGMVRLLLDHGVDIDLHSRGGFSALAFAVRAGGHGAVRVLLESGADVNDMLRDGTSVLMLAIVNGHYDLAAFLLDEGANPDAIDAGRTALHILVQTHNWDGLDKAGVVEQGEIGYLGLMEKLLAHGADPNAGMTRDEEVRFPEGVTASGQSFAVGVIGATPFWWAARSADLPAMRVLLAHGADPLLATAENVTPLAMAAGVGYLDGQTPGTEEDALEAVRMILERGADINAGSECARDANAEGSPYRGLCCGWTPLHGAASRGADSIITYLVENGAQLDARDQRGRTPLDLAEGHVLYISVYIRESSARLLRELMREQDIAAG
ncbi:MAG: ankyrin repeat domain-containing protein [Acidobacteria bacterium]|nr:ankyrin repeat domain-containing protein [Acidobacteriota bacterium]